MRKSYKLILVAIVLFYVACCSESKSDILTIKVVKALTNYPINGSPEWYHPPPIVEFIMEVKNTKDYPVAIPLNLREDFSHLGHVFFSLDIGCKKDSKEVFLYSPTGSIGFIGIESDKIENFSLIARFQQLDSLFNKCGTNSMNEFLLDVIMNGKIQFHGKDSIDEVLIGQRYEIVEELKVVKSKKIEILEPSNLN